MRALPTALIATALVLLTACATAPQRDAGAGASQPSPAAALTAHDPTELRQTLRQADTLFAADKLSEAESLYGQALADPAFPALGNEARRAALSAAGRLAVHRDDLEQSGDLFRRAIAANPVDAGDHYYLSLVEFGLGDKPASARLVAEVVRRWPPLVHEYRDAHLFGLLHDDTLADDDHRALLEALWESDWAERESGADAAWLQFALLRLASGDRDGARDVVVRIRRPEELVAMRADRRFDDLLDPVGPASDLARAASAYVERVAAMAQLDPSPWKIQVALSYARLTAGQHQAVIDGVDDALARLDRASETDLPGISQDDVPWLLNNRAIALRRLGRFDAALADLDRASGLAERGGSNISQVLNKALYLAALLRPGEALAELADLREPSVYGQMVRAEVEVRAGLALGDRAMVDKGLAFLREHRQEHAMTLVETLARAGEIDEAAQVLIDLLADPDERDAALWWLQDFRAGPALPDFAQWQRNRHTLLARPDVNAAVDRVGRIESLPIFGSPGMD